MIRERKRARARARVHWFFFGHGPVHELIYRSFARGLVEFGYMAPRAVMYFLLTVVGVACVPYSPQVSSTHFVKDPSEISVYGLIYSRPTDDVAILSPLLEQSEASGGSCFDSKGETLFVANAQGIAMSVQLQSGKVKWRYQHVDPFTMPPVFLPKEAVFGSKADVVVFGSQNGELLAFDAATGARVWEYDLGGELRESPILARHRLIVANSRNQVLALDPVSGKFLWQHSHETPAKMTILGHSGVLFANGKIFVGFSDGLVTALEVEDGSVKWSRPLTLSAATFGDTDTTPALFGDKIFVASFSDGLFALEAATGNVSWQRPVDSVTRLLVHKSFLYMANHKELDAVDAQSGRMVWRFNYPSAMVTRPVVYGGYVVFGARPGGLYVLDVASGRLIQRFHPGGIVGELTFYKGLLAFLSEGSNVYALKYGAKTGALLAAEHRFEGL